MISNLIAAGVMLTVPFAPAKNPEKETQQTEEIVAVLPDDITLEDVSDDLPEDEFLKLV